MEDDADRSKKLLSADAVPEIQVPDSAPIVAPTFRLPSVLGKPARPAEPPAPTEAAEPASPVVAASTDGEGAAGKPAPRRKRPSTGRFRDRTLNWFKTGDELDPGVPASTSDYEPIDTPRPRWLIPAIVGGVMFAVAILALALS